MPLRDRCKTGITVGVVVAAMYVTYVLVAYVVTGGRIVESRGVGLVGVLAVYLAGGVVGGLLYGVAAPLARWRLGAFAVGFLVSIPVFFGAAIILPEPKLDNPLTWGVLTVSALLIGGPAGVILLAPEQD